MGAITLDVKKVNSNVFLNIEKANTLLQESYDISTVLKNKLPISFPYRNTTLNIINKINTLKTNTKILEKKLEQKVISIEKIEKKEASSINKITSLASQITNDKINFGKVKLNSAKSKLNADVENTNVKKNIFQTGANIIKSFSSKITTLKENAYKKIKETRSKITNKFKSKLEILKAKKTEVQEWLLNKGKELGKKVFEDTKAVFKVAFKCLVDVVIPEIYNISQRCACSIFNAQISIFKGVIGFIESLLKGLLLLVATTISAATGGGIPCLVIGIAALIDVISSLVNGKWEWKALKWEWKIFKCVFATSYTNKVADWYYNTESGKALDDLAYKPFKNDGTGCKIIEGISYVASIVALSIATYGIGTVVSGGTSAVSVGTSGLSTAVSTISAVFAGTAGIGKYTAEEWNKNHLSLTYNGEELELTISYEEYLKIVDLKKGESTTIKHIIENPDGTTSEITFTITANGDDTFSVKDRNGNEVDFNGVKESNTLKGFVVGGIKGIWEAFQWYVGGKIGTGQFTSVTSAIKNEVVKKITTSGIRVGLDTLTGVVEVPFQSLVTMFSEGKTWKEAWESQGGWEAVATQAGIAGISSFAGEAFDLNKIFKGKTSNAVDNVADNVVTNNIVNDEVISEASEQVDIDKIIEGILRENDIGQTINMIKGLSNNDLEAFLKKADTYRQIPRTLEILGDDFEFILKKVTDDNLLYKFYKNDKNIITYLDGEQVSKVINKLGIFESKDYAEIFRMCNDTQLKDLIKNISDDKFTALLDEINDGEKFRILPIAELYNKTNIMLTNLTQTSLHKILKESVDKNINIDYLFKYLNESKFNRIYLGCKLDLVDKIIMNIKNVSVKEKVIEELNTNELLLTYLNMEVENGVDISCIIKYLNGPRVCELLEKLDVADSIKIINQLDKTQYKYVVRRLEGTVKNKLALEYGLKDFYNKRTINLQKYFEDDIILKLQNNFGTVVSEERIKSLVIKLLPENRFKDLVKDERAMAFNDGTKSVMNLAYDDLIIKNNTSHENIHGLSANDGIGSDGYFHTRRGLSVDGKNTGIDETVTEYLNELSMGDDYYTKITGELYSGYQEAVIKFKELINNGIIDNDKLIESYFTNDLSYLENEIVFLYMKKGELMSFGRKKFAEMMDLFDDAIGDDYATRKEALDKLDKIISDIVL